MAPTASLPATSLVVTHAGSNNNIAVQGDDSNWADFSNFESSTGQEGIVGPPAAVQVMPTGLWSEFKSLQLPVATTAVAAQSGNHALGFSMSTDFGAGSSDISGFINFGGVAAETAGGWMADFSSAPAAQASVSSPWSASFESFSNQLPVLHPASGMPFGSGNPNSFPEWAVAAPTAMQGIPAGLSSSRNMVTTGSSAVAVGGAKKLGAASGGVGAAAPVVAARTFPLEPHFTDYKFSYLSLLTCSLSPP